MKSLVAVAKDEDEIVIPKKPKASKTSGRSSSGWRVSHPMLRLMRGTSAAGIALGGFVTLVGAMAVVGLAFESFWVRFAFGLVVVIGLPGLLADQLLKRSDATLATRGGIGMVVDVFAIVLLGVALLLVGADVVTSRLFVHEGDLYARHGDTTMARAVYFVAGVSPVFPAGRGSAKPGASASASTSAAPAAPPSGGPAK